MIVEKFVIVRNKDFYNESFKNQKEKKSINVDDVIDVEGTYEEDKKD